ncbi:hypothetical protein V1517DRAFT_308982 [Lipomyces orientalis]|uniref:Uncharacterized protein n=1 Tax=Lipomyces orientalis TaxID=1233043 RepID=A0ACC3TKG5_9ASCO
MEAGHTADLAKRSVWYVTTGVAINTAQLAGSIYAAMLACRDAGNPNNNRRKECLINIIVSISIALSTVRSAGNDAGVWYRDEYAITWIKLGKMKEFNNLWNGSSNPDVYLVTQGPHSHFIWEENGHGRGYYSYKLNGHAAMTGEHRDRSISGRDEYLKQSFTSGGIDYSYCKDYPASQEELSRVYDWGPLWNQAECLVDQVNWNYQMLMYTVIDTNTNREVIRINYGFTHGSPRADFYGCPNQDQWVSTCSNS